MLAMEDLKEIINYRYPLHTYARIQSLGGCHDEIDIIAEAYYKNQKLYITKYKGKKCTSIFNPFVNDYYTDDVYTILKED